MASTPMTDCPTCGAATTADARFCASCGTALGAVAGEERKLATILFADVIGSTDLGEQLDPERLRALLQEYFAAMSRVIEEWGGTVEKYIGDAILAVFGVPTAREDDPIRALQAAAQMLSAVERLNDGFEQRHGVRLAIRLGVNTGEVLAPMGARPAGQFLVSGDAVNVAARLEQAAEPNTVLVGERTWSAARRAFEFEAPVELALKGKRELVRARRLGEPLATEGRHVRLEAPMVGRDRELETLVGLLDEAVETQTPRLVLLSGPAGIGKSRMLREFVGRGREQHEGLAVLRGRCLAAGHGITFWALGEVLRQVAGISLDESGDSAVDKLRQAATDLLAPLGLGPADLDETTYALATSANIAVAGNPLEALEPEAVAEEMARAWPRFLMGLAARAPTVVLLEDIHWADERMVAMLELLASRTRGPLVLLATARPEFVEAHPGFGGGEVTTITLRPLTEAQSEHLVAELLGDADPLKALLGEVREKAEGNPFFLEEILQRLIDEGALVREDGRWRATALARAVKLPDTIHGLLAARIDGLPADEKSVLQQAAVVGRIFWPGSLASVDVGARDSGGLGDRLRALERKGLVTARPISTIQGETEYTFRHVLIRDVAYASVPKARRARAHAETARWIERLAGDRLEEFERLAESAFGQARVRQRFKDRRLLAARPANCSPIITPRRPLRKMPIWRGQTIRMDERRSAEGPSRSCCEPAPAPVTASPSTRRSNCTDVHSTSRRATPSVRACTRRSATTTRRCSTWTRPSRPTSRPSTLRAMPVNATRRCRAWPSASRARRSAGAPSARSRTSIGSVPSWTRPSVGRPTSARARPS